jgi:flagellar assembly protein FliH
MPLSNNPMGSTWQRWDMDALSTQPAPTGKPAVLGRTPEMVAASLQKRESEFQARQEIQALRDQVAEEARHKGYEEGFSAAQSEGFSQGLAEGRLAGQKEMHLQTQIALEPIGHLIQGLSTALKSFDHEIAESLALIALKIGQQLAADSIKQSHEAVCSIVRAVLHSEPEMIGKPRLRANPKDIEIISSTFGNELQALDWQLIPDDNISQGGCKVVSKNGEIDATWETRWAQIQAAFSSQLITP